MSYYLCTIFSFEQTRDLPSLSSDVAAWDTQELISISIFLRILLWLRTQSYPLKLPTNRPKLTFLIIRCSSLSYVMTLLNVNLLENLAGVENPELLRADAVPEHTREPQHHRQLHNAEHDVERVPRHHGDPKRGIVFFLLKRESFFLREKTLF